VADPSLLAMLTGKPPPETAVSASGADDVHPERIVPASNPMTMPPRESGRRGREMRGTGILWSKRTKVRLT